MLSKMNAILLLVLILSFDKNDAFPLITVGRTVGNNYARSSSSSLLCMMMTKSPQRNIKLSLLDLSTYNKNDKDSENNSNFLDASIIPLPSLHLEEYSELRTQHIYGMKISRPIQKMILRDAIQSNKLYGHIVYKKDPNDLVGAIGCTSEVLLSAIKPILAISSNNNNRKDDDEIPNTLLCRGSFRFVVKEVIQTIPYPVAIVDEWCDDDVLEQPKSKRDLSDSSSEVLCQQILSGLHAFVKQKVKESLRQRKKDIENSDIGYTDENEMTTTIHKRIYSKEISDVLFAFHGFLIENQSILSITEKQYAIAFFAAELIGVDNEIRKKLLKANKGIERLKIISNEVNKVVSTQRMVQSIVANDDDHYEIYSDDFESLPAWSKNIKKGMVVEYFWDEDFGWRECTVVNDPIPILNELLITVHFEDDQSTRKLPFRIDDKKRWRQPVFHKSSQVHQSIVSSTTIIDIDNNSFQ
mmetsp:Transcript_25789/g.29488  ORF Transcript_25789/g.29488 Transcript_25789/m.29488 type:complete len:469 (-) Transcript_25789:8-1414(-)